MCGCTLEFNEYLGSYLTHIFCVSCSLIKSIVWILVNDINHDQNSRICIAFVFVYILLNRHLHAAFFALYNLCCTQ